VGGAQGLPSSLLSAQVARAELFRVTLVSTSLLKTTDAFAQALVLVLF
jgi:hypothetical protein